MLSSLTVFGFNSSSSDMGFKICIEFGGPKFCILEVSEKGNIWSKSRLYPVFIYGKGIATDNALMSMKNGVLSVTKAVKPFKIYQSFNYHCGETP